MVTFFGEAEVHLALTRHRVPSEPEPRIGINPQVFKSSSGNI
jgi:hypothetical protein